MKRTHRLAVVMLTLVATTLPISACGIGLACPAIGWSNVVAVEVGGDASAVTDIQVCDERGCSSDAVSNDSIEGFRPGERMGGQWRFDLPDMSVPERITVRAIDAGGVVLSETDVELEWVRVGGSEQCGGPGEARVTLTL